MARAGRSSSDAPSTGEATTEFQPLVRDVRALVERLASEREREARGGRWSPDRLRSTLTQYLQGEQVVILANREPYIHERTDDGVQRRCTLRAAWSRRSSP